VVQGNHTYMKALRDVYAVSATTTGSRHQHPTKEDLSDRKEQYAGLLDVAAHNYFAMGQRVRLTRNVATGFGLFNNASGVVVDIVTGVEGYAPSSGVRPVIIVDFPTYTGPAMSAFRVVALDGFETLSGVYTHTGDREGRPVYCNDHGVLVYYGDGCWVVSPSGRVGEAAYTCANAGVSWDVPPLGEEWYAVDVPASAGGLRASFARARGRSRAPFSLCAGLPRTWVPVGDVTTRCSSSCCTRTG
jgi:hypothetical protein